MTSQHPQWFVALERSVTSQHPQWLVAYKCVLLALGSSFGNIYSESREVKIFLRMCIIISCVTKWLVYCISVCGKRYWVWISTIEKMTKNSNTFATPPPQLFDVFFFFSLSSSYIGITQAYEENDQSNFEMVMDYNVESSCHGDTMSGWKVKMVNFLCPWIAVRGKKRRRYSEVDMQTRREPENLFILVEPTGNYVQGCWERVKSAGVKLELTTEVSLLLVHTLKNKTGTFRVGR